jgi:hypothetical protein
VDDKPENRKAIRDKLRAKIRSELIPYAEVAERSGRIPGLGPTQEESTQWALPVPWAGLSIIADKIARGCEYKYKDRKRFVEPPYGIRTFVCDTDLIPEPFASASKLIDFGPGCKIRRVFFTEDPNVVWYWISIWNTLWLHVRIEHEDELLKTEPHFRKCEGIIPREDRRMDVPLYLRHANQQPHGQE